MDAGLLPIKRLDRAKSRLADRFAAEALQSIVAALVEDAFALCRESDFLRWWIVSDDDDLLTRAAGLGFDTVRDEGAGLNDAVTLGAGAALEAGATSVVVLPVDVPLTTSYDLLDLRDTGESADIVCVPSTDGGTNALSLRPPDVLPPSFGPGSLRAHLRSADRAGLRCALLDLPRMALDLDTADDVKELLRRGNGSARQTIELLGALEL